MHCGPGMEKIVERGTHREDFVMYYSISLSVPLLSLKQLLPATNKRDPFLWLLRGPINEYYVEQIQETTGSAFAEKLIGKFMRDGM